jgi:GNAT superfamily N-acetyltransferase
MPNCGAAIEVRRIGSSEVGLAAAVLGNSMRDSPVHVAAFGGSEASREKALTGVLLALITAQVKKKGVVLAAFKEGEMVGVCGMMRPGFCQFSLLERLALLPNLLWQYGVRGGWRLISIAQNWSRHDFTERHWHLGPVGVLRELQGQGIGSSLLRQFTNRMDDAGAAAWLETDKAINVFFYRQHGFEVEAEDLVRGVHCWFMKRTLEGLTQSAEFG